MHLTDHQLKDAICRRLARTTDDAAIGVAVHRGVVTLSGVVHEWTRKHAIEQLVRDTPGVRDLANDIVLEYRGCAQPCDATLVANVRAALAAELDASKIAIVVDDRSVTLSGEVATAAARDRAIGLACSCRGVLDVDADHLRVTS